MKGENVMRKTKPLSLFMALLMIFTAIQHIPVIRARASTALYSGECGSGITWTLDDAGLLTVSGSGNMSSGQPWEFYAPLIYSAGENYAIQNGFEYELLNAAASTYDVLYDANGGTINYGNIAGYIHTV